MAIAYDAATTAEGATTTTTWSHTCTGSNRILFVGVNVNSATDKITGVTYNGVAMSRVVLAAAAGSTRAVLYVLANPASGANNIIVTSSDTTYRWCAASSYTGAAQSGQPDASNSATTSGTSISVSTTTVADNCWVTGFFFNVANTSFTAGANTTLRNSGFFVMGDTNAAQTPAGSKSIAATWTNSNFGAVCAASFSPFVPSTFVPKIITT